MIRRATEFAVALLFAAYLAILLRLTVFRPGCFTHPMFHGVLHIDPISTLLHYAQVNAWRVFYTELLGNIVCFMPFGGYFAWRHWSFKQTVLASFLMTAFIECGQFILGSGVTETSDLILNTFGGMLGWIAGMIIL